MRSAACPRVASGLISKFGYTLFVPVRTNNDVRQQKGKVKRAGAEIIR
jgi:hypothetical protein